MDLTTVLSIPRDHKDFVDGRYIGENVRPILDYTDQKAFPDFFLIYYSFEKAFDCVGWNFNLMCLLLYHLCNQ